MDNKNFKDKRLLTRFIREFFALTDTPSLIQYIAAEEDYLSLCSAIVNDSSNDTRIFRLLKAICRTHGLDFQDLKEKLTPAGKALGLVISSGQVNYYELLEISPGARKAEVKKAFRKKVRKVHPDTSSQISDNSQDFINLKAAYQILSDPLLRRKYDETFHDKSLWKEKDNQSVIQKRPDRTKILYQLGAIFLLMILAVFILDFLYRHNSILDGDLTIYQKQVTEQRIPKEDSVK